MDYDFRNRVNPPYDPHQIPMYRPTTERPVHGPSSLYPRIGQPGPTGRHSSPSSSSPSAPGGLGIRVAIKPEHRISPPGSTVDPVVSKYIASGLSREAVPLAVASYGDNPAKVREFVNGYTLLRDMGFSSKNVAEALAMYDNDTDKALAHFLNSSS
ncbi:uncharacterized protein LOC127806315 isoform X3 [Diospyros lotus]|uniref:uncharacterized protein LOC127806315 isoform X3 n=1 Tax=Diospyros lotus TaxID=55363 RepID=UPI00225B912C|nr:uncharacterized protein LOC127806315 isoform X3 [Diospyros lotus]